MGRSAADRRLSKIGAERDIASRLHVVLPGSPNRGMFGGDGAYGEAKSALDAVVARWHAESSWAQRVSLAHALIGWTRGTGLMGHNDAIVSAVEKAGVTTYSTDEMASMLLELCDVESKAAAAHAPLKVDLTGGLADAKLDMADLAAKAREQASVDTASADPPAGTIAALPSPPRGYTPAPPPQWDDLDIDPADLVVIVGGAELGPYGSSRTRFEMEVDNELSAAGVLELAWTTGLIRWHDDPSQAGMTPNPVSWSTNPSSSSATTTPWWNGSGSASGSTTARSTPTTPRRFWSACFWTRTSRSWCPAKPRRGRSCSSTPTTR
ncbi:putative FATTY ACID SYNTHASE FAS domain protein [Mycobacterium xenopi 3993]|nr:putative FATTY ACID SYNTHASE FAS domain protein [Mycobacterium xenopi 3993]